MGCPLCAADVTLLSLDARRVDPQADLCDTRLPRTLQRKIKSASEKDGLPTDTQLAGGRDVFPGTVGRTTRIGIVRLRQRPPTVPPLTEQPVSDTSPRRVLPVDLVRSSGCRVYSDIVSRVCLHAGADPRSLLASSDAPHRFVGMYWP